MLQTQQPQASTSNNSQVTATPTESKASEGSSVNVNDHLKQIAQRESGGNIHAVNQHQVQLVSINSYNQLGIQ